MKTVTTLSTIALFAALLIFTYYIGNELENDSKLFKEQLGTKIVLNKDTLLIVDYSMFESVYILENGKKINKDLIEQLKIK